jgi:DNA-binding NarL/FixJ family response regulator
MEILKLVARGMGNKQICETLSIADSTVRNHITVIYSKLGVHDRYSAVQKAMGAGLV